MGVKRLQIIYFLIIQSVKTGYNWKVYFQNAMYCVYIQKNVITGLLFNMLHTRY